MTDPYVVLGVSRNATEDEIKKAYRTLSRKYHPDANINNPNKEAAEEKFKEVQAAYNRIMDERQNGYSTYGGYSDYNTNQRYKQGGYNQTGPTPEEWERWAQGWYNSKGRSYGYSRPYSGMTGWCLEMLLLNLLCNLCCCGF